MWMCVPAFPGGCVVMSTGNPLGRWAVKNCTLFKAGNICKKPIKSMVPPIPDPFVPNPNASCAPGWRSREGLNYCYKVCYGDIHIKQGFPNPKPPVRREDAGTGIGNPWYKTLEVELRQWRHLLASSDIFWMCFLGLQVFHEERLTRKRSWEEAERFCEALGGHLPSLTETKDMESLNSILRDSIRYISHCFSVNSHYHISPHTHTQDQTLSNLLICICAVCFTLQW